MQTGDTRRSFQICHGPLPNGLSSPVIFKHITSKSNVSPNALIIIIISKSYIHTHLPNRVLKALSICKLSERQVIEVMNSETQMSPYKGLQGATTHSAATARNTGPTPSLFDKCTGLFYMRYTTHGTSGLTHPKDEAMVKCLV